MNRRALATSFLIALGITAIFFYKTILLGRIPFPGDLLVSEYKPWRTTSYLGYNPGSIPNKAQYPDTLRQIYPWKTLVIDMFKKRELPLWNPYNFSGSPLLANFQSAVFYPLSIVYFFLPMLGAWTMLVFLEPFLALWFTYLYIKKLGGSNLGAWLGGISYAFSSFMTVWLEYNTIGHVIVWLPLILLAIEQLKEKTSRQWIIIIVAALTSSLFAGHPQLFTYLLIFCFVYAWFRLDNKKLLTLFLFPIGLGAIQLIPGIELITNAARSPHPYDLLIHKILIQPWQLLMLIAPNIFGNPATRNYWLGDTYIGKVTSIGLVPLFFLPAALRTKTWLVKFYAVSSLVILLFTTANPVSQIVYKIDIPFVSGSSPTLILFLFSFSLAVLSGLGMDAWRKEAHRVTRLVNRAIVVALFFSTIWIGFVIRSPRFLPEVLSTAKHAIVYESFIAVFVFIGFAIAIARPKIMTITLTVLLALHLFDQFIAFHKFNPFVPQQLIFPHHQVFEWLRSQGGLNRFWGYGNAAIEANFATQYRVFSPDGYDPLYPKWYGEFIAASSGGILPEQFTTSTRSDATIAPGFGELDLPNNLNRLKILDSTSVGFVLDHVDNSNAPKTFSADRFNLIEEQNGWKYYHNKEALPRIYLVTDIKTYHTKNEFAAIFFGNDFDLKKTALVDTALPFSFSQPLRQSDAKIETYQPHKVTAVTQTDVPAFLILTDTYFPGWKVNVDNQPTSIYRVNYTFRGTYLPAGKHTVQFVYTPWTVRAGEVVSLTSFFFFLFFVFAISQRYNTRRQ